jgi:tripartite-type tricarboxylate transporter receptor subunit TctC
MSNSNRIKTKLLKALMAAAGLLIVSSQALAQAQNAASAWPTKPIKIVIPAAAGSAPDIMTRLVALELQKRLGQPVVAENKPGAGGALGSDIVAKSAPDGYTFVMGNIGSHAMNVGVYPKLPYSPVKDFEAVAMVAITPSVMSIASDSPVKNLKEFIDYARKEGKNGELITFASGGNGSSSHLAGEYMNLLTGMKMRHVPYKDVPQALGDVAAGRVSIMISNLPPAMPQIRGGKLRPLAVTTTTRSKAVPDVPTMQQAGLAFEQTVWFALFAPAGTPSAITERLHREISEIQKDASVTERIAATGATPLANTPAQLKAFVASEVDKWNKIAQDSGAKAD